MGIIFMKQSNLENNLSNLSDHLEKLKEGPREQYLSELLNSYRDIIEQIEGFARVKNHGQIRIMCMLAMKYLK